MVICKKFTFECAHIVRNCSSERCRSSIHGHSYVVEIFLTADKLDKGQMIYDFGLLKGFIRGLIDCFDHSLLFWNKDNDDYKKFAKEHSERWISLPVSTSAEMLSLLFLKSVNLILKKTEFRNGEGHVIASSLRVHESTTAYAESFLADMSNENFPALDLGHIEFSSAIRNSWADSALWQQLLANKAILRNPEVKLQV